MSNFIFPPCLRFFALTIALLSYGPLYAATSIEGRDIYFDNDGLIVHKDAQGNIDGGDTAQREGWYWFGIWLRQNTPGAAPWKPSRNLNFEQVLKLLEPKRDGVFYR